MTRKHFEAAASVLYRLVTANERSMRAEVDNGITGCPDGLADDPYIPEGDFYWYTRGYGEALASVAGQLATEFEGFNPNFDRERFLEACGLNKTAQCAEGENK